MSSFQTQLYGNLSAVIFVLLTLIYLNFPDISLAIPPASPINYKLAQTTTEISQYGITWKFARPVVYGQFVSGDYWVLGTENGIDLTSITPEPINGRNGSQVNPINNTQPFDSRAGNYDSSLSFLPIGKLYPGDSLISTKSEVTDGDDIDVLGRHVADSHSFVQSAAVLTVLSSPPESPAFRPPVFGKEKPLFYLKNVDLTLLKNLHPPSTKVSHLRNKSISIAENYSNYLTRPWIIWGKDWLGRFIHPLDNMPNYYEYCFYIYSESGIIINSNLSGKERVAYGLIQLGIDTSYTTRNGFGDRTVSKFPMLIAGTLLSEPDLYANSTYKGFKEILQTYYGKGWQTPPPHVLWRQKVGNEHEETYPCDWPNINISAGGGGKMELYRRCCSGGSWSGIALAIHAMRLAQQWNHMPFLDYVDRWHAEQGAIDNENLSTMKNCYSPESWTVNPETFPSTGSTESEFTKAMWNEYRAGF